LSDIKVTARELERAAARQAGNLDEVVLEWGDPLLDAADRLSHEEILAAWAVR